MRWKFKEGELVELVSFPNEDYLCNPIYGDQNMEKGIGKIFSVERGYLHMRYRKKYIYIINYFGIDIFVLPKNIRKVSEEELKVLREKEIVKKIKSLWRKQEYYKALRRSKNV